MMAIHLSSGLSQQTEINYMSKLGEYIALKLNHVFPTLTIHNNLEVAKRNITENQKWAYDEIKRIVPAFEPYWNLRKKNILDIGTGLGGKLPYYIESGAKSVIGVDINLQNLRAAYDHIRASGLSSVIQLVQCDAARLPFPDNSFDSIISINVFEHIEKVDYAVREVYRVIKPGGLALLHLPPYYSAWGPHLENWIHFPWPHLLFSEKTLMRVAAIEDRKKHLNDQFIESARIDWQHNNNRIPGINHVTLQHFHQMVLKSGFFILQLKLLPTGYDFLNSSNSVYKKLLLQILIQATNIPILQEVIVTKMVYVLQKRLQEIN